MHGGISSAGRTLSLRLGLSVRVRSSGCQRPLVAQVVEHKPTCLDRGRMFESCIAPPNIVVEVPGSLAQRLERDQPKIRGFESSCLRSETWPSGLRQNPNQVPSKLDRGP